MTESRCSKRNIAFDIQDAEALKMEECHKWLKFAKADFDSAKYLNDGPIHPKPLEIICYHSQQAAEKAVKAVIVFLGGQGSIPKVHNIVFLLRQVENILRDKKGLSIEEGIIERGEQLTRYSVAPRYPGEIHIDESETEKALRDAEAFLQWANDVISPK